MVNFFVRGAINFCPTKCTLPSVYVCGEIEMRVISPQWCVAGKGENVGGGKKPFTVSSVEAEGQVEPQWEKHGEEWEKSE